MTKIVSTYWNLASDLLEQWMNSTPHKNILNSNFNYLGCGSYDYLDGSYGDRYIKSTQKFSN